MNLQVGPPSLQILSTSGRWTFQGERQICNMWGFPKIGGTFFGGSHNKDYSILGSILGSPYFGKLPYLCIRREMRMLKRYACGNRLCSVPRVRGNYVIETVLRFRA